ncbi:MAG: AraC family transcriptional regulator [Azonexus sp.]|nr:AraC family transcriptional regulator [Azonexus sp.]
MEPANPDLYLDTQTLDQLVPLAVLNQTAVEMHGTAANPVALPPRIALDRNLQVMLLLIRQAGQRTLHEMTLKFLVHAAAAHIVETQGVATTGKARAAEPPRLSRRKMEQIETYIEARLAGEIRVDDLARQVAMSRSRFMGRFKATTGTTPHQFIIAARVRVAKALLAEGGLSLAEIAARTGFASPSHFASVFRRLVKCSPSAYHRQVAPGYKRDRGRAKTARPPQLLSVASASVPAAPAPAPGLAEFQLEQTSLPLNRQVRLLKSSQGLGWTDLFAAITDEQPHEGLRGAVPAVWIVTSTAANNIQRIDRAGMHDGILPQRAISVTGAGEAVYDELGAPLEARHLYLRQSLIDEIAEEMFKGSAEQRFIGSSLGRNDPLLYRLITAIREALNSPPRGSRLKMDCLAQALASHLLAHYSVAGAPRPLPVHAFGARQTGILSDYINDNLAADLSLNQLAQTVGLSRAQFSQRFKATALMTPHQFVTLRRIKEARKLLARHDADFALIALTCGFADQSHFTAAFKRIVGLTPGEYWRQAA